MMFELFLALAWYQMIGMVVFPILFLIFVFNEEVSASLIFLGCTVSFLQYFNFIDLRTLDLVVCLYAVVIYLVLGCIWSLFKYKQKAEEIAKSYQKYRDHTKEDVIKSIKNNIYNYQIANWIIFFPISIIKFLLSDFVDYLISKLGRIHDYIARKVVDSIYGVEVLKKSDAKK